MRVDNSKIPETAKTHKVKHHSEDKEYTIIMNDDKMIVCKLQDKVIWIHKNYKFVPTDQTKTRNRKRK